jgi:hypothetical protein
MLYLVFYLAPRASAGKDKESEPRASLTRKSRAPFFDFFKIRELRLLFHFFFYNFNGTTRETDLQTDQIDENAI